MTDIVERLRADPLRNFDEAADEIKRLREQLRSMRTWRDEQLYKQSTEIERLRSERDVYIRLHERWRRLSREYLEKAASGDAEIERLRDRLQVRAGHVLDLEQTVKQRAEEIERLKKLVREALNGPGWMDEHWHSAAREVVGDE